MVKNTLTIIGILAVLFLSFSIVSADISFSPSELTGTGNDGTSIDIPLRISSDYSGTLSELSAVFSNLIDGSNIISKNNINVPQINSTAEIPGDEFLDVILTIQIPSGQTAGIYKGEMNFSGAITSSPSLRGTVNITLTVTESDPTPANFNFCDINGAVGDLEIADIEFTNLGEGEDDDWFLLDEIEIEVEVENTHNQDNIKNVLVEIMILDDDNNDVTSDFDFKDEEIDLNTIKDDDSEIAIFRISELPADLNSGDYRVYIKAYSEDDEDTQCIAESNDLNQDFYHRIEVTREDDPAVIIKENQETILASCGDDNVLLPFNIYNLGSDKEKKVLVTLSNSELGIEESIVVDNLKSGKRKEVVFNFNIPEEASEKLYKLKIRTHYDYDDDEDELDEFSYSENSFDDLDKDFTARLEILSCKSPLPSISAKLESTAEIGTDLIIKALVTNNGKENNFLISSSEFETWAELVSITPQSTSIKEGEFKEVIITLRPTQEGSHSFKINTIVDGELTEQLVSVNIEKKPSIIFSGSNSIMLYAITGIIAILILIFLVLIVRASRKSTRPEF